MASCGIYSVDANCAIKLPDFTSIFSAEAIAITIAAHEDTTPNQINVIFIDSASVLSALEHGKSKDPHIQQPGQRNSRPTSHQGRNSTHTVESQLS